MVTNFNVYKITKDKAEMEELLHDIKAHKYLYMNGLKDKTEYLYSIFFLSLFIKFANLYLKFESKYRNWKENEL